MPRSLYILLLAGIGLREADAKGILVKFLPNPPEDSIVRYDVYRSSDSADAGTSIGSILPIVADTLRYPDLSADKGTAYFYSIRAVNGDGLESDPSDVTAAAMPALALPDTLRADSAGAARWTLSLSARPLPGVPLFCALVDSSRFSLVFDSTRGKITFVPRAPRGDTAKLIVRASYFGKFEDRDTVLVMAGAPAATALRAGESAGALRAFRGNDGTLRLSGLPREAWVEIAGADGARIFRGFLRGPETAVRGLGYRACYVAVRDAGGRLLAALRPAP